MYTIAMASTAVAVLLGCSVTSPQVTINLLPVVFVPQMLFAVFFVAVQLLPSWIRYVHVLYIGHTQHLRSYLTVQLFVCHIDGFNGFALWDMASDLL